MTGETKKRRRHGRKEHPCDFLRRIKNRLAQMNGKRQTMRACSSEKMRLNSDECGKADVSDRLFVQL